jgi:hypothetical protein
VLYEAKLCSCRGTASSGGGAELSGFYDASHYEELAASGADTRQREQRIFSMPQHYHIPGLTGTRELANVVGVQFD